MPVSSFATLHDFALIPKNPDRYEQLAQFAEPEDWGYKSTLVAVTYPVLRNYLNYTFQRLRDENKIAITAEANLACFNSGLVTPNQEEIFVVFTSNKIADDKRPYHFHSFATRGQAILNAFTQLPDVARYFDDPSVLVLDTRLELRINVEHIVEENKERFGDLAQSLTPYQLVRLFSGAVDHAKLRVRGNYKTAIPQYYKGEVQLLLPLCLRNPAKADLALAVERQDGFYRAATCLTLDMAYNNARQLARPDKDWLQP